MFDCQIVTYRIKGCKTIYLNILRKKDIFMNMTPLKIDIFIRKKYIYPTLATTLSTFLMFHKRFLVNRKTC